MLMNEEMWDFLLEDTNEQGVFSDLTEQIQNITFEMVIVVILAIILWFSLKKAVQCLMKKK